LSVRRTNPEMEIGDLTGDQKMKNEGIADQAIGKVKNMIGSAKDKIRETLNE